MELTNRRGSYHFQCELEIGGQIIEVTKEKQYFRPFERTRDRFIERYELIHIRSVDEKWYRIRQTFEKELISLNDLSNNNPFLMTNEVIETNMDNEEVEIFKQIWNEEIIPQQISWSLDRFGEENNQNQDRNAEATR